MKEWSDQQLLRAYAEERSEAAFAELARRHLDFVYSAALRMVRDAEPARDVAQGVFVALARNAGKVAKHRIVAGWLHRTTRNLAATSIRADVRRRTREQEAMAMSDDASEEAAALWNEIAPQLDDALEKLREPDREALLLRYFQGKSIREVAAVLATSEDAAQKRVSRALERLRAVMARRGVMAEAHGIAISVAANAVKAAPAGMGQAVLNEGLRAGSAWSASAAAKGIIMWQKAFSIVATVAIVGTAWYAVHLSGELRALRAEEAALKDQLAQAQHDLDDARNRLALRQGQRTDFEKNARELARLRAEVSRLRDMTNQMETTSAPIVIPTNSPVRQVTLEGNFITLPGETLKSLGIQWTSDGDGGKYGYLTSNQLWEISATLSNNSDVHVIALPKVTTLAGRQAAVSIGDPLQSQDKSTNWGASLDMMPNYSTDTSTFDLSVIARFDVFIGDPIQQIQSLQSDEHPEVQRGQTFVVTRELPSNGWNPVWTNTSGVPQSLLVMVTPELIDPAGNLIPYE